MKEIQLTQGQVALVDDDDYEWLNQWKWCAQKDNHTFYAHRSPGARGKQINIPMHRLLIEVPDGFQVDHIDGNGLNNQRGNLRAVTPRQNALNKHGYKTSKYVGVTWKKDKRRWKACTTIDGVQKHLGYFTSEFLAFGSYCDFSLKNNRHDVTEFLFLKYGRRFIDKSITAYRRNCLCNL